MTTENTEASLIRCRRAEIPTCVADNNKSSECRTIRRALRSGLGKSPLTKSMEATAKFLLTKRATSRLDAINNKLVLKGETTELERDSARQLADTENKNTLTRIKKAAAYASVLGDKPLLSFSKQTIFIASGVPLRPLDEAFRSHRMCLETVPGQAELLVVRTPSKPAKSLLWTAVLRGSRICDSDFVRTGGREGCGIKYECCLTTPRTVWPTALFKERHPSLCQALEAAASMPGSRWIIVHSEEAFRKAALTAVRRNSMRSVIRLGTRAETVRCRPKVLKPFAFSPKQFVKFVSRIDLAGSRTGLSGM